MFKPDLEVQRGGDGGSARLTSGGVVEGGRKEMTRDGSARGVSKGVGVGVGVGVGFVRGQIQFKF